MYRNFRFRFGSRRLLAWTCLPGAFGLVILGCSLSLETSAPNPSGDAGTTVEAGRAESGPLPSGSEAGSEAPSDAAPLPPADAGADAGQVGQEGGPPISALNPPDTYVQLFKWRWADVATECTTFLGPNGFGGVQISPPQASINTDAWWNMYQPVNYQALAGDMGTASALQHMVDTCHAAGVRVYVDAVFNHLASGSGTAADGTTYDSNTLQYPFFGPADFHPACDIQSSDYAGNRANVVRCRLDGLPDLATETAHVRGEIAQYLNSLVAMGVDGFRVDAAKHMWPADLLAIFGQVAKTTQKGEPLFITQEVIPDGTVHTSDYFGSGTVNEFSFTYAVRDAFRNNNGSSVAQLPTLIGTGNGGGSWNLDPATNVTVFVDNHDTERSRTDSLNLYDDGPERFELANIYLLAQPYGRAQLQSGFVFSFGHTDANAPTGSPYDTTGKPLIMKDWDFVHRWAGIAAMVAFRSATAGQAMVNVQSGNGNQLAFSRGNVGFVALNNDAAEWNASLLTGLPAGTYCNIVDGSKGPSGATCTGDTVTVDASGRANVSIPAVGGSNVPAVVIFTPQRLP